MPQPVSASQVKVPSFDLGYFFRDTLQGLESEINTKRATPLTRDEHLDCAAYLRAKDLVTTNYWSHTSPVGFNSIQAVDFCAATKSRVVGETLAKDQPVENVVRDWFLSEPHKKVLLDNEFKKIGLARFDNITVAILSN